MRYTTISSSRWRQCASILCRYKCYYIQSFSDNFDDGNVTIAGALTQNSDATLKKNILPISSSISSILALQGYHYQWKDGFKDQTFNQDSWLKR
ncbi:MAG: tail fiber domain-containing protein [Saprospiraceae bacterium]|nr:tail fiber domain-containing protein [Saprospiraceae bacterium]